MADEAIIGELIATYRELNHRIRGRDFGPGRPESELDGNNNSIAGILYQMRNRELRMSQTVKRLLAGGEALPDDEDVRITGDVGAGMYTATVLLSQFGTAREATLSQVRGLSDEGWAQVYSTPRGSMSLKDLMQTLIDRDRERLQEIDQLLQKTGV
jgi:hypothetical protein